MSTARKQDAADTLYEAEALMRARHGIGDRERTLWGHIADSLNDWASRARNGIIMTPREVRGFNRAVAIASQYIELFGPGEEPPTEGDIPT